jgi:hypothetical protein
MTDTIQTVHFLGRVLPPECDISIGYDPVIHWNEPALLDFEPAFVVRIKHSSIDVECQLDEFRVERYISLHIRAFDLARTAVDLMAFSTGYALTVIFTAFVHPDGGKNPLSALILASPRSVPRFGLMRPPRTKVLMRSII